MRNLIDSVAATVLLNGGEIAGKTRLQKTFYLLEAMELGFGVEFDYHRFGPFSADLIFAAEDAEALGYLTAGEYLGHHKVPHKTFKATEKAPEFSKGDKAERRQQALNSMKKYSSLQLELAATAVYLRQNGYPDTYWDVVRLRKPLKATDDQVARAENLIAELGL